MGSSKISAKPVSSPPAAPAKTSPSSPPAVAKTPASSGGVTVHRATKTHSAGRFESSFSPKGHPNYSQVLGGGARPMRGGGGGGVRGTTPLPAPGTIPADMPRIDASRVTINGGTAADLEAQLAFLWQNGSPDGQAAVRAFVNEANNGGDTVNLNYTGDSYMQAGPGLLNLAAGGIPSDFNGQARWMMSFVHEMNHFTQDWAYSGSTYGEQRAYLKGYDFLANSMGMSNDQIRNILGPMDPTYIIGTMVREYQIDPGSNAFLEFMRNNLGVGTGLGTLRDIAGSNQAANSSSPLDETGDGLDANELLEVAQDIATPNADIRHLRDDPNSVNG